MSDISARLSLPYLAPAQAQKHVTHNEALTRLDLLVQLAVAGFNADTPPATPVAGEVWATGAAPSGAWAGQVGQLASWDGNAWIFAAPVEGWVALGMTDGRLYRFDGAAWVAVSFGTENLDGLGIGTASDATNRLAVASDAVLLTHAGAGHQLKLNKAASGDTASLLFQTGFSGRAEMGTAGTDDFAIKVSADGAAWADALVFAPTGTVSGTAVQTSATDTSPGRLARADYAYGPGNLLGTTSQAGGTPTGAVIETGSTASGTYTRFADGTQIVQATRTLGYATAGVCTDSWSFPAAFATPPVVSLTLDDIDAATPAEDALAAPRATDTTASATTLRAPRVSGTTSFASGDTLSVNAIAIGRWF